MKKLIIILTMVIATITSTIAKEQYKEELSADWVKPQGVLDNKLMMSSGKEIFLTSDINKPRENEYKFNSPIDGVHVLPNGWVLVATSQGRFTKKAQGTVYLSKDNLKTFTKVLNMENGSATHMNFDSHKNGTVYISEYGIKDNSRGEHKHDHEVSNARNIYKSTDFGQTFTKVYAPKAEVGYHNHVITIDKQNPNKVYQVIGDTRKRLLYTEDGGKTWKEEWWGEYHPISAIDYPDFILYGLDNVPYGGIVKMDKKTKKISKVFQPANTKHKGPAYTMIKGDDGYVYVGFTSYAKINDHNGSIYRSKDLSNWELVKEINQIKKEYPVNMDNLTYYNNNVYVYVSIPKQNGEIYRGTLKLSTGQN